jgi:predicted dehydrogenase
LLTVGVIGCGYWGPNLIRNFSNLKEADVRICSDLDEGRLKHMKLLYPSITTTTDYGEIIRDESIDAVVIATPVSTHYKLAAEALEAGKHVFCEKPLTQSVEEGTKLIGIADDNDRTLMVGHTFVYTAAVNKVRDLIKSGELGDIHYMSTARVNLGLFQEDINVVWDLAPHDVSIMNYILGVRPVAVSAVGHSYIQPKIQDVSFVTLRYPGSILANLHVSWLNPNKIRSTTVVGSKKMLVYDDISSRYGDIHIPKLDEVEPLKTECQHFIDCIAGSEPQSSGRAGLEVLIVLDAIDRSMMQNGAEIEIVYPETLG